MSVWSFPRTQHGGSIVDIHAKFLLSAMESYPTMPAALSIVQVLGGYDHPCCLWLLSCRFRDWTALLR